MHLARQGVQRLADVLVRDGLAVYEPNPAHRRAKLLRLTPSRRPRRPGPTRWARSSARRSCGRPAPSSTGCWKPSGGRSSPLT
jgi:hypothetical protein